MNNKKILSSIDLIIEGLTSLKAELSNTVVEPVKEEKAPKKVEKAEEPVEEKSSEDVDLASMKFSELKKYASNLGVSNSGTREEIIDRIKKSADKVVDFPAKEEDIMNPPETDEFAELAKSIADETPIEEIISALADVNVKATKKNAIEKLEDALRSGLIELDDEDEEEEEVEESKEEPSTETDEEEEIPSYNPVYDPEGYNDPDSMSEERREACEDLVEDILNSIGDEKLSLEDVTDFVEKMCTEDELALVEDADDEMQVLGLYIEIKKRLIDNEGNLNAPNEPYELGEANFCCGHELKYDKKSHMYICEICGQEYEADEEE